MWGFTTRWQWPGEGVRMNENAGDLRQGYRIGRARGEREQEGRTCRMPPPGAGRCRCRCQGLQVAGKDKELRFRL